GPCPAHPIRKGKQAVENEAVKPVAVLRLAGLRLGLFLRRAEWLDQPSVPDARGTGGFTSAAVEAQVEMFFDFARQFQPAVNDRSHQINPAAGAVVFVSRFKIRRTGRRTQPAVYAVEERFVVD